MDCIKILHVIITFYCISIAGTGNGQHLNDAQWLLEGAIHLDFRGNDLELSIINSFPGKKSPGAFSTSICTDEGELLFYSGGCEIINRNHIIMLNGDSLNPGARELGFCKSGSLPWDQCIAIIPFPGKNEHYLTFTLDVSAPFELGDSIHTPIVPSHLLFHEIDMNLDGGLGSVIRMNNIAIDDTLSRGYLQAIPHANGRDWWITVPEWNTNCYYSVLVSIDGIQRTIQSCLGLNYGDKDLAGFVHHSPNGQKYARCRGQIDRGLEVFDFNRCSGLFSNPILLNIPPIDIYFTGVGFSPDSRFLYVTTRTFVWQFDLASDEIQNSMVLVGELLPENAGPGKGTLYHQQIGLDGIIYISSPGNHTYLSTINNPNNQGSECDFRGHNIMFPNSYNNYRALPNNALFRLGPIDESDCDSLNFDNIPVAKFRYEADTIDNSKFKFINLSYFEPESYYWNFGDGFDSYEKDPFHNFEKDGMYNVCLTVSNSFGTNQVCKPIDFLTSSIDPVVLNSIEVYPNPANNTLWIVDDKSLDMISYQLLNIDGNLIYEANQSMSGKFHFDISSLPTGIYLVKKIDQNKNIILKKVSIIH